MTFFNNFKVNIDPTRGVMTLTEIDLNSVEGIYGGYDESMWRMKFRQIRVQLDRIEAAMDDVPSSYGSLMEQLEGRREYWSNQLDKLEERAHRAGVPHAWRE